MPPKPVSMGLCGGPLRPRFTVLVSFVNVLATFSGRQARETRTERIRADSSIRRPRSSQRRSVLIGPSHGTWAQATSAGRIRATRATVVQCHLSRRGSPAPSRHGRVATAARAAVALVVVTATVIRLTSVAAVIVVAAICAVWAAARATRAGSVWRGSSVLSLGWRPWCCRSVVGALLRRRRIASVVSHDGVRGRTRCCCRVARNRSRQGGEGGRQDKKRAQEARHKAGRSGVGCRQRPKRDLDDQPQAAMAKERSGRERAASREKKTPKEEDRPR